MFRTPSVIEAPLPHHAIAFLNRIFISKLIFIFFYFFCLISACILQHYTYPEWAFGDADRPPCYCHGVSDWVLGFISAGICAIFVLLDFNRHRVVVSVQASDIKLSFSSFKRVNNKLCPLVGCNPCLLQTWTFGDYLEKKSVQSRCMYKHAGEATRTEIYILLPFSTGV